jgi:hypothetical protein
MTVIDALAVREHDARRAVTRRLDDVQVAVNAARVSVANHALPSTTALRAKAAAVTEAVEIWEATAHALAVAEEQHLDRPMYVAIERSIVHTLSPQDGA